tara:strand:- start:28138 stop:28878 length:741 start_codon:yes stop_codon:yes gene_type:complete
MLNKETDWEPSEDEVSWTKDNLDPLQIGGVWSPHGLEYERTGDNEITLISISNHEGTIEAHARICKVIDGMGWSMVDDSVQRITNELDASSLEESQQIELERIQEIVSGWKCSNEECEEYLVNMPVDYVDWVNHGSAPFKDPDTGEEGEADRWLAHITCHSCNAIIPMNPMDYGYIAGEDMFYSWRLGINIFRVLTREETVALVDGNKDKSEPVGFALGSTYMGHPVPPHMQGTYCVLSSIRDEEE